MRFPRSILAFALPLLISAGGPPTPGPVSDTGQCEASMADPGTPYYQIHLVSTRKLPGTRQAAGLGNVMFKRSPFGVAVSPDGQYVYDLAITVDRLSPPRRGVYVAWVTTPEIDRIRRIGPLDAEMKAAGSVDWNKFLVVITLEPSAEHLGEKWTGPVVLRGMSKSGFMHTMAGHGPYQQEPCASYGYN